MTTRTRRWCFADQLGPHFLDAPDQPVLLIESRAAFQRRRLHRRKAHLVLSALRHRAAELGDQAVFLQSSTYRQALGEVKEPISVCAPTSFAADQFVRSTPSVEVLPSRGFCTDRVTFEQWANNQRRLVMENFYRDARRRLGLLMDGEDPTGLRWNFDAENREPPPKNTPQLDVPSPWQPDEDAIDEQVRADLNRWERDGHVSFVGRDGPREFPVTAKEAERAFDVFVRKRLPYFGAHQDAMLEADRWMAHSLLSASMNLGLLDPLKCAYAAQDAYLGGRAPLASVEGYIRQLIGWRDYIWHTYWHFGPAYRRRNALAARSALPRWFAELDADAVQAHCLKDVLAQVRDHGWTHHIPRLMVLSNYALQRGWHPASVADWFQRCFVDGYEWVMTVNVIGMSQHADSGLTATKPYAAGGAYIDRMSDYCSRCKYRPAQRVGPSACPFTGGYWWFMARNAEQLAANRRLSRPLGSLQKLSDLAEAIAQQKRLGNRPP
jgi:deoxyribodipyrimidine photolyase-related protein